ncbi:MAG: hypothetical protein WDM91_11065 [Rhizomicrobium sp.]
MRREARHAEATPLSAVHETVLLAASLYGAAHTTFAARELREFMYQTGRTELSTGTVAGALVYLANRDKLLKIGKGEYARKPERSAPTKSHFVSSIPAPTKDQLMAGRAHPRRRVASEPPALPQPQDPAGMIFESPACIGFARPFDFPPTLNHSELKSLMGFAPQGDAE